VSRKKGVSVTNPERGSSLSVRPEAFFWYALRHVAYAKYRSEREPTYRRTSLSNVLYTGSVINREFLLQNAKGVAHDFWPIFCILFIRSQQSILGREIFQFLAFPWCILSFLLNKMAWWRKGRHRRSFYCFYCLIRKYHRHSSTHKAWQSIHWWKWHNSLIAVIYDCQASINGLFLSYRYCIQSEIGGIWYVASFFNQVPEKSKATWKTETHAAKLYLVNTLHGNQLSRK
jgi:hypothetical protein